MSKIIKAGDLDIKKVNFADNIKTNKYGGKSVYINYNNGPFRVQMPKMSLPFGVSVYKPDVGDERYSLEMSWNGIKPEILESFKQLEEKIIDYAEKNSKELFKKQKSREVLEELFQHYLRIDKDEDGNVLDKYAPRLKVKMYSESNSFSVDAYDAEKVDGKYPRIHLTKENISDYLSRGSKCEAILQCSGFWVVDGKFGISWVLVQVKIHKNENKLVGYAFEEEDEEGDDEEVYDNEDEVTVEEVDDKDEESEPVVKEKKQRRKREYL